MPETLGVIIFTIVGLILLGAILFIGYTVIESDGKLIKKIVMVFGLSGIGFSIIGFYILFLQQIASVAF